METPVLASKSFIEAAILAVVIIAALLIVRQLHQAGAASDSAVHSLSAQTAVPASQTPESSSAVDTINSSLSSDGSGSTTNTSLSVNGQDIALPANGTVNQTLTDGSTTTTINAQTSTVSSGGQGQASSSNSSSVNIRVNSTSKSQDSL